MFRASLPLLRLSSRAATPGFKVKLQPSLLQRPSLQGRARLPVQSVFYATKSDKDNENPPPPKIPIDYEHERELGQRKLESNPSKVTVDSSRSKILDGEPRSPGGSGSPSLEGGLKGDIEMIRSTFRLDSVPKESLVLGAAGTLPYVATSISTVFLAWNLTKELPTGNFFFDHILLTHENAQHLLGLIEPIQLGYGAIIISFLGAIHWGLEYAEKQPSSNRTRFRYGMGLGASIIAWPTLLMPIEYALTAQFAAFTALYFADSRAAKNGWAPRWYGMYRFLLTAVVGLAIFISLVGRASITRQQQLGQAVMYERLHQEGIADKHTDWAKLEEEEKEKNRKKKEAEEKAKKEAEAEKNAKEKKEKSKKPGKDEPKSNKEEKKEDEDEQDSEGNEDTDEKQEKDEGGKKD
ncbi:hypothetical protein S40288_06673 [Stachybotrys chartarum IBT 40288]|nr:hypothetical protein S40288_06673 [Stachybotrys chartarum IBT 40288]